MACYLSSTAQFYSRLLQSKQTRIYFSHCPSSCKSMAYGKMRQRSKYIRVMGFNVDLAFIQRTTNRAVERRVRASNCGNWPIRLL